MHVNTFREYSRRDLVMVWNDRGDAVAVVYSSLLLPSLVSLSVQEVDMWSMGVVAFNMLSGKQPFVQNRNAVNMNIIMGRFEFDSRYWSTLSKEAKVQVQSENTVFQS